MKRKPCFQRSIFIIALCLITFNQVMSQDIRTSRQSAYYTLIWKLNEKEALKLYQKKLNLINESYFHTRFDSFLTDQGYSKKLPYGHYLFVKTDRQEVKFELRTVNPVNVWVLNNSSDFVLLLTSQDGSFIQNAQVKIGARTIKYDSLTHTYQLHHANTKGILKINYLGLSSLYIITRQQNNSAFKRASKHLFFRTPLKYIAVPVVMTISLPLDIYRLTVHHQRRGWIYWVSQPFYDILYTLRWGYPHGFIEKITNPRGQRQNIKGYLIFNKTAFRPGDTVFWKAYLLNKHDRPLQKRILLRLSSDTHTLPIPMGAQTAEKPGVYFGKFTLSDSLQLKIDSRVALSISYKKHEISESFKLEDYEVKHNRYDARPEKTIHYANDTNAILLSGQDENHLALADARAHLLVTPAEIDHITDSRVFVPDTLWETEIPLEVAGETRIELPTSIFPPANFNYNVRVSFLNSSNELSLKELKLRYIHSEERLSITLSEDSLLFENLRNGLSQSVSAFLAYKKDNEVLVTDSVMLPFKCRINSFITRYVLSTKDKTEVKDMTTENALINCYYERNADSLSIAIENPRKLPLTCFIYDLNKEVYRSTESPTWIRLPAASLHNYYIVLNYIWHNQVMTDNYVAGLNTSTLTIQSDQPDYIYPGKKVTIKLKVMDYQLKPVKGADILAFGMNSSMPGAILPRIPNFEKKRKQKEVINQFFSNPTEMSLSRALDNQQWKQWRQALHLDSSAYYQFLHPGKGMTYWNFEIAGSPWSFISPYVVRNGNIEPIYAIYINEKLVYTYLSHANLPYLFKAPAGISTIRLRIPGAEITIPDFTMKAGNKYIVSVENDTSNHSVRILKKSFWLTSNEIYNISSHLMIIDNQKPNSKFDYILQDNDLYPINVNFNQPSIVGPLTLNEYSYVSPGNFRLQDKFESGYSYQFRDGLIKMKPDYLNNYRSLFPKIPSVNFSETPITESEWLQKWSDEKNRIQSMKGDSRNPETTGKGYGKMLLSLDSLPKGCFIKNTILLKDGVLQMERVYSGWPGTIHQLSGKNYKIYFLLNDNSWFESDSLSVKKNGSNLFRIYPQIHSADERSVRINQLIMELTGQKLYNLKQENYTFQQISNSYYTNQFLSISDGKLIDGNIYDLTTNESLPGVNIVVRGTNIGTVSDLNGYFSLRVPEKCNDLDICYIGYLPIRVPVDNFGTMNISLQPDVKALEEVVVIGYGVQRKSGFTGATSTIQVRGIGSLSGKVAGVEVTGSGLSRNQLTLETRTAESIKGLSDPDFLSDLKNASTMRFRFSDNAFWQPALTTDNKGEASFEVTFPEDITAWKTFYIAMGKRQIGSTTTAIQAFKPLSVQLSVPGFLTEGDTSFIIGKINNYRKDSILIFTVFKQRETSATTDNILLKHGLTSKFAVTGSGKDTVKVSYQVGLNAGMIDGEERSIPVYPRGIQETAGKFKVLNQDSVIQWIVPADFQLARLNIESSVLNVIRSEVKQIHQYGYLCNEQAASKLKSLLVEKKICGFLREDFKYNSDINKLIKRLEETSNPDHLWGWWKGCESQSWISLHVIEALLEAENEGYKITVSREEIIAQLMIEINAYSPAKKLQALKILYNLGAKLRYDLEAGTLLKAGKLTFAEKLAGLELQQKTGIKINLDSLIQLHQETMFGNYFWNADTFNITSGYIQTTLSMYRLLKNDSTHLELLSRIRNFFLEERRSGSWRNTYESANILETILPDLLEGKADLKPPTLKIKINSHINTLEHFPFSEMIHPGDTLELTNTGSLPVYVLLFENSWNKNPLPLSAGFTINAQIAGNPAILKAGKTVEMEVTVKVKKKATYVMIEIPIPAGCSYADKRQGIYPENHREYYKNKVCIFCEELPAGVYTYKINLIPRYQGHYIQNPAKAEMMYYPVFYGRDNLKNVSIEE